MAAKHETENECLVRRAVNLFTFLGRAQQLLVQPVRTVDKYEVAMWFADLPRRESIFGSSQRAASLPPMRRCSPWAEWQSSTRGQGLESHGAGSCSFFDALSVCSKNRR
ncbi:hypothetical protein A5667_03660 [Mycolicibacterium fortuitum]|nr:hypothetical protein A5667_03660 [Mycolicibacterium fortuitum]